MSIEIFKEKLKHLPSKHVQASHGGGKGGVGASGGGTAKTPKKKSKRESPLKRKIRRSGELKSELGSPKGMTGKQFASNAKNKGWNVDQSKPNFVTGTKKVGEGRTASTHRFWFQKGGSSGKTTLDVSD